MWQSVGRWWCVLLEALDTDCAYAVVGWLFFSFFVSLALRQEHLARLLDSMAVWEHFKLRAANPRSSHVMATTTVDDSGVPSGNASVASRRSSRGGSSVPTPFGSGGVGRRPSTLPSIPSAGPAVMVQSALDSGATTPSVGGAAAGSGGSKRTSASSGAAMLVRVADMMLSKP